MTAAYPDTLLAKAVVAGSFNAEEAPLESWDKSAAAEAGRLDPVSSDKIKSQICTQQIAMRVGIL